MARTEQVPWKTALVTGASSGLGRGIGRWLADRGVHVYAAARREPELRALADECRQTGGRLEPLRLDVTDAASLQREIPRLDEACGGLDLVVANAGVGGATRAKRLEWEDVERIIQVNVTGAAATLAAALPRMVERDRGHLVGVSSLAAYRGLPGSAAYCASKAFLSVFLEGLRVDLASTSLRVTTLYPGFVKSEMTAKNTFRMPFLMETDAAVERIGRALARGAEVHAFPWQLSSLVGLTRLVPARAWKKAAYRLR